MLFYQSFELISSVSKSPNSINIKGILSHTDSISSNLTYWDMSFFVDLLTIFSDFFFQILFSINFFLIFIIEEILLFFRNILSFIQWEILTFPLPFKRPFTVVLRAIEKTTRTDLIIDNSNRLQPIGNDDIGIHGCNIYMIN